MVTYEQAVAKANSIFPNLVVEAVKDTPFAWFFLLNTEDKATRMELDIPEYRIDKETGDIKMVLVDSPEFDECFNDDVPYRYV